MRPFVEVCRRRRLKVNGGKSKMMVMNGEDRLECEVYVDGICLEHVSEFKYLRQCYGRRRRALGLGLYRWTSSEACLVLGG